MGRRLHYVPGSFYRKDDRSGFPTRAENTRKEWNGFIVDRKLWEPRQPQDLVKGVKDNQTVPEARPLPPNFFVGPIYLQTAAALTPRQTTITLQNVAGVSVGDQVSLMMDDGVLWPTMVTEILPDAVIEVAAGAPLSVSSGAVMIDYRGPFPPP